MLLELLARAPVRLTCVTAMAAALAACGQSPTAATVDLSGTYGVSKNAVAPVRISDSALTYQPVQSYRLDAAPTTVAAAPVIAAPVIAAPYGSAQISAPATLAAAPGAQPDVMFRLDGSDRPAMTTVAAAGGATGLYDNLAQVYGESYGVRPGVQSTALAAPTVSPVILSAPRAHIETVETQTASASPYRIENGVIVGLNAPSAPQNSQSVILGSETLSAAETGEAKTLSGVYMSTPTASAAAAQPGYGAYPPDVSYAPAPQATIATAAPVVQYDDLQRMIGAPMANASAPIDVQPSVAPTVYLGRAAGPVPPQPQYEARVEPQPTVVQQPEPRRTSDRGAPYPRLYDVYGVGSYPEQTFGSDLVASLRPAEIAPSRYITAAASPVVQAPAPVSSGGYVIQRGDTIYSIGRRSGVPPQVIAAANGMPLDATIYPGQRITIPSSMAMAPGVATIAPAAIASTMGAGANPSFDWPSHGRIYAHQVPGGVGAVDIRGEAGSEVAAASDGTVEAVEMGPNGALVVVDHANGWKSFYLGLDRIAVRPGQPIGRDSALGVIARSGDPLVRFEIRHQGRTVDPIRLIDRG